MVSKTGFLKFIMVFSCVSWLRGCGDSPAEPDGNGTFVPVALDVSNEDGELTINVFSAAKDHFIIGEGGAQNPNALVYEIVVTNEHADPVHDVMTTTSVAPHSGILACGALLDQDPAGGANPSIGVILGLDCSADGFTWDIGTLDAGESAVLYFRAEALEDGDDVNRVMVTAEGLEFPLLVEEPTLIGGNGVTLTISSEDGRIISSAFDSSTDPFLVGAGSSSDLNSLVYEIAVTNQGAFTATGIQVSAQIPRSGSGLVCREILEDDPAGGDNPNIGSASCMSEGLSWFIGNLGPGEQATLYARVEALSVGNHVSRITLGADALSHEVRRDELTTVVAPPILE